MAAGYGYGDKCFASQQEAIDAFFSEQAPTIVPLTGVTNGYLASQYSKSGSMWTRLHQRCIQTAGGRTCTAQIEYVGKGVNQCVLSTTPDPYDAFIDGNVMGWAVVAAMAVAWGVMHMRRAL